MESAAEERVDEDTEIVPKPRGGNTDEVTPAAAAKGERDGGQIHPGLKEVEPSDVRLEVGREPEREDEQATSDEDQQVRSGERADFHTGLYDSTCHGVRKFWKTAECHQGIHPRYATIPSIVA